MADPVVVIGAGIGGLSSAIRLAAAGQRVMIVEQNPAAGGKMGQICQAGFRWDTGPSVITMRHVLDDLFAVAGRQLDDYLTLQPVEPLTRYFYPDGVVLDASRDLARMTDQIARLDERDVEGYLAYLAYAARLHRITGPVFIYDRPPTWRSFSRVSPSDAWFIDPLRSMDQAIRSFVASPHLRQLLGRFATYVGASPYQAPATLNVIAHVELTGGVWYPHGGVYAIARSLMAVAQELGVEFCFNCPVQQIVVERDRAVGVVLNSGDFQPARTVIANVDVATVYHNLLPSSIATPRRIKRLTQFEPSCSGFILLLGVNRKHPELAHHNIFFSDDYPREFADIFRRGIPPEEPTIYVAITAKSDPTHAPEGSENWFVLVNAPPLGPNFTWETQAQAYRNRVLARLAAFGFDIRAEIAVEKVITPVDLARLTGAWRGALYGASSNSRWAAFRRPNNRCRDVAGLYFAGGTTHPGGGVPMVALSGRVAAEMALEDLGVI
ncbi:MAG: phytoene desaturase [Anaerolineae bacterium]|nr:phytoene desaturase [Anaerolineae bacterium]